MKVCNDLKRFFDRTVLFIARGFGTGLLPLAPGTWGSLPALFFFLVIYQLFSEKLLLFNLVIFFLVLISVPICNRALRFYTEKDPSEIVYDEIAGQLLTLYPLFWFPNYTPGWVVILSGFLLFRFFDITKVFPVNYFEKLPAGWGVAVDDWVAGIYGAGFLFLTAYYILPVVLS